MYVVQSVSVRKVTVYGGVETNEYVHMVYLGTPMRQLQVYLYTTGSFKRRVILKQQFTIGKGYYDPVYNTRVSIIANSSSTTQNYETILSGAGSHGKCATFGVWVEAFGAELLFQ